MNADSDDTDCLVDYERSIAACIEHGDFATGQYSIVGGLKRLTGRSRSTRIRVVTGYRDKHSSPLRLRWQAGSDDDYDGRKQAKKRVRDFIAVAPLSYVRSRPMRDSTIMLGPGLVPNCSEGRTSAMDGITTANS